MAPEPGKSESSINSLLNMGAADVKNFQITSSPKETPLGKPAELPENQMQKIPSQEFKTNLPDIKMRTNDEDPKKAAETRAMIENLLLHQSRSEDLFGDEESIKAGSEAGYVGFFIRNIRELQGTEDEAAKEKSREKIAEAYLHINHTILDEMDTVNGFVERLRNGFPYDTRWSIQMFEQLEKRVNAVLREKGERKITGEGKEMLKMFKKDARWAIATAKISEAMGPGGELYYDGELKLQRLRTPHGEVLSSDFVKAYQDELKGLVPTEDEKSLTKKILSKIPQEYVEGVDRYANLKERGLREVAIEYQDAFDHWMLAGIASGQRNLENGFVNDLEAGEHYMDVDKVEFRFLNEVFDANRDILDEKGNLRDSQENNLTYINARGEKVVVKKSLLNPFCMPRDDELAQQAYQARMHELVVNHDVYEKALARIRIMPEATDEEKATKELAIIEEADKAVKYANGRIKDWENRDIGHPFDRLAYTVIDNQINLERGVLGSGDLGWGWVYERNIVEYSINNDERGEYIIYKNEDKEETKYKADLTESEWGELVDKKVGLGKENIIQKDEYGNSFIVKRKSELGSIYDNHDVTTVFFWARHIIDYDKMADTRGTLLFPTIGWYRELWESQPPYWRPRVEEFAKDDHLLLKRLGLEGKSGILADGPGAKNIFEDRVARKVYVKGKVGLQPQYYGKFDAGVRSYIKENMWAFVTCWLNNPGSGSGEYNLVFPVFLPTMVEDINFWRSVTLKTPSAKIRDYPKESIWHQRLRGTRLSELNWENMPKYKYNWVEVNHDQMERWFGPLITPHQVNSYTGKEYEKHYHRPSGFSEKEGGKRFRLGPRASKWRQGIIRAAVSSQNKVLSSVSLSSVMGVEVTSVKEGLKVGSMALSDKLDEWRNEWITPWGNTLLDMPSEVVGVNNYPGTSTQVLTESYLQVRRIVESAIVHSHGQSGDVNLSIDAIERDFV